MDLIEGTHYTRTGWREGEEATLDNRPSFKIDLDAWNAAPGNDGKRAFNDAHRELINAAMIAYEAALTPEQKAERAARFEAEMMAEANRFYASRAPGDNRSFWD